MSALHGPYILLGTENKQGACPYSFSLSRLSSGDTDNKQIHQHRTRNYNKCCRKEKHKGREKGGEQF